MKRSRAGKTRSKYYCEDSNVICKAASILMMAEVDCKCQAETNLALLWRERLWQINTEDNEGVVANAIQQTSE